MKRLLLPLLLLLIISRQSTAQRSTRQDTTYIPAVLEAEIVITAFEIEKELLRQSGSVKYIPDPVQLSFAAISPVQIFNTVPGVRFEERAMGSYRIAIRGSSLRSPFGVRNVKVYWNGIPFTQPTGSTPFNLLDNSTFESISVLKGPTGSVYGAGTGGTILIESDSEAKYLRSESAVGFNSTYTVGEFGLRRFDFGVHASDMNKPQHGSIKISTQSSDGYRDQNFMDRLNLEYVYKFNEFKPNQFQISGLISDLNYGIPGGLNADQFAADPTQARQGNPFALGSVDANASIDQLLLLSGITHTYKANDQTGLSASNTIFFKYSDFENPFNLDYKRDERYSYGLRSTVNRKINVSDDVSANIVIGTELQYGNYEANNFENDSSRVGTLNFSDELNLRNSTFFLNSNWELANNWSIEAGFSLNKIRYEIDRTVDNLNNDAGKVLKEFDLQFVPRIGISKELSETLVAHGSVSYGFSAPTLEEIRTNDASLNLDLNPEEGINYEIGLRGFDSYKQRLFFDISVFYFDLNEAIVQLESPRGTTLFANSGSTNQWGLEADMSYAFTDYLNSSIAYTYHRFTFDDYVKNGEDFSGNELTGVAPHTVVVSTDFNFKNGLFLNTSYNFTDEIPLDDGNTIYAEAYHLIRLKAGYVFKPNNLWKLEVFTGIDNLLDETYSLGNDINAFGGRFFQPSPPRNFYGGLRVIF